MERERAGDRVNHRRERERVSVNVSVERGGKTKVGERERESKLNSLATRRPLKCVTYPRWGEK